MIILVVMNELNNDILDSIFLFLTQIKDIRSFIEVNKGINARYKDKIEKYKIKLYANKDYLLFYKYLNQYQYDKEFMSQLIARVFMNVPKFRPSPAVEMYDLRYIFELMFKGYALDKDQVKDYNVHLYIHFYHKIMDCLDVDRQKTIQKIEKSSYLFSLKQNPKINKIKNNTNFKWISIRKD